MRVLHIGPSPRSHRLVLEPDVPAGPSAERAREVVDLLRHHLGGVLGRGHVHGGGAGGEGVAAAGAVETVGAAVAL